MYTLPALEEPAPLDAGAPARSLDGGDGAGPAPIAADAGARAAVSGEIEAKGEALGAGAGVTDCGVGEDGGADGGGGDGGGIEATGGLVGFGGSGAGGGVDTDTAGALVGFGGSGGGGGGDTGGAAALADFDGSDAGGDATAPGGTPVDLDGSGAGADGTGNVVAFGVSEDEAGGAVARLVAASPRRASDGGAGAERAPGAELPPLGRGALASPASWRSLVATIGFTTST
jgi:hypothetical protein